MEIGGARAFRKLHQGISSLASCNFYEDKDVQLTVYIRSGSIVVVITVVAVSAWIKRKKREREDLIVELIWC